MLRFGEAPYLECSSRGDKRFSAFYARVRQFNNRSIEELYQAAKEFEDGSTGLTWREAKGRQAINMPECRRVYNHLWCTYIMENPQLLKVLREATGLSDIFGQEGHACQAEELWKIRNDYVSFPRSLYDA